MKKIILILVLWSSIFSITLAARGYVKALDEYTYKHKFSKEIIDIYEYDILQKHKKIVIIIRTDRNNRIVPNEVTQVLDLNGYDLIDVKPFMNEYKYNEVIMVFERRDTNE